MRLDLSVQQILSSTRNEAKRAIAAGLVRVNGRICEDKGHALSPTDKVEVATQEVERVVPQPEIELTLLAQGEGWIVVDKPPGMPVHPLRAGETDTVLNGVVAMFPQVQCVGEEGGLRSGIVHRLDVETSGALAIALTDEVWRKLRLAFSNHTIRKTYLAEVSGLLKEDGKIELDLVIRRHSPAFVCAAKPDEKGARACRLSWKVREVRASSTVIEVDLDTGFLHQIRATFAHLGHPLVGDVHYGGPPAERLMLQAWKLECEDVGMKAESSTGFSPCEIPMG